MKNRRFDRRAFLKHAIASSAAGVTVAAPQTSQAQQKPAAPTATAANPPARNQLSCSPASFTSFRHFAISERM
jgi:hypothetical protein